MLKELNLDDQNFERIVEEARNKIMGLYAEWTDFNYHDPGITLIELFAWIKEYQQYYLNQTGNEMKYKFLKLLGVQKRNKKGAKALLQFTGTGNRKLYRGTKVYAGSICFETMKSKQFVANDILFMMSVKNNEDYVCLELSQYELDKQMRFYPFGENPQRGDAFYLAFDSALPAQQVICLYLDIWEDYSVLRNEIKEKLYAPLAEFKIQYYTENGWEAIEWCEDLTYGLLTDGFLSFRIENTMRKINLNGQIGYCIRILLEEQEYDIAPCITRASINIEEARQRDTLCECEVLKLEEKGDMWCATLDSVLAAKGISRVFLEKDGIYQEINYFEKQVLESHGIVRVEIPLCAHKEEINQVMIVNQDSGFLEKDRSFAGKGLPFHQINLEDADIEYESFLLMVQEEHTSGYCIWDKVEDFGASKSGDRHYILDAMTGLLYFGDDIHGKIPKGRIEIISYVRTLGSKGNVKENKINELHMNPMNQNLKVQNIENAWEGCDEESLKDCFLRAGNQLKIPNCAVTDSDYENYVMKTPGLMIEACKVITAREEGKGRDEITDHTHTLVIKPFHTHKMLPISRAYEKNIRAFLEPHRMLGINIKFRQPEYIPVSVTAHVIKNSNFQNIKQKIGDTLTEYFSSKECLFGITLSYGQIYGLLDQLPEVSSIRWLSVEIKSSTVRHLAGGDIVLPANGLMYLQEVNTSVLTQG